jgi:hypothetical protein
MSHTTTKTLRETLERARFHDANGRPRHCTAQMLAALDILVSEAESNAATILAARAGAAAPIDSTIDGLELSLPASRPRRGRAPSQTATE